MSLRWSSGTDKENDKKNDEGNDKGRDKVEGEVCNEVTDKDGTGRTGTPVTARDRKFGEAGRGQIPPRWGSEEGFGGAGSTKMSLRWSWATDKGTDEVSDEVGDKVRDKVGGLQIIPFWCDLRTVAIQG
jgi:hypothetical protein